MLSTRIYANIHNPSNVLIEICSYVVITRKGQFKCSKIKKKNANFLNILFSDKRYFSYCIYKKPNIYVPITFFSYSNFHYLCNYNFLFLF